MAAIHSFAVMWVGKIGGSFWRFPRTEHSDLADLPRRSLVFVSDSTPKFDRFCVRCRSQSEGREPVSKALAQVPGTTKDFSYSREILARTSYLEQS